MIVKTEEELQALKEIGYICAKVAIQCKLQPNQVSLRKSLIICERVI